MAKKHITIKIPEDKWNLISETLNMDCQSNWIDEKIRKDIQDALNSIIIIPEKNLPRFRKTGRQK